MKRWGLRHKGFRVGFIGVVVCSIFFVIGFAAPAWKNTTGLWMSCSHSHRLCVTHSSQSSSLSFPAWFDSVRVLECLSLIAILLCIAAEVYMDFLSHPSPDRRLVELLAMIAGTCGVIGSIIFAVYTPLTSSNSYYYEVYLSWGFGLATASSCFLIAFASIIAYFRRKGLDVTSYGASNAVHYHASDGMVVPQGFNGTDLGPPAYSEVVNQPGRGAQGSSGSGPHPSDLSLYPLYKPPAPQDSQPPPAYFPPPPSGQFQAPPPYTIVPPPSTLISDQTNGGQPPESGPVPVLPTGTGQTNFGPAPSSSENSSVDHGPPDIASPPLSSVVDPVVAGNPVVSSVPVYYVTVLGQMVPVFREELQQAGRDVPTAGAPVPAYFIVTQGQHVPVYSEEQARALTN